MHPTRTSTIVLFVAGIVLVALSPVGQPGSFYWSNGPSLIGNIGWFGFLLCVLLLIVSGLYTIVSRFRHTASA